MTASNTRTELIRDVCLPCSGAYRHTGRATNTPGTCADCDRHTNHLTPAYMARGTDWDVWFTGYLDALAVVDRLPGPMVPTIVRRMLGTDRDHDLTVTESGYRAALRDVLAKAANK